MPTSRFKLLYAIFALLLFSCGNFENKPDNGQNEKVEDSVNLQDYIYMQSDSKSFKLLQGTWQSLDNTKSKILFEGNLKIDIYDDTIIGEKYQFSIADRCTNASAETVNPKKDRYLVIKEFDQCFYISKLENNMLELSLVGRGNTLRYQKIEE